MKPSIAIYVQHYLAPSMTFIYRQIKAAQQYYNPLVICSDTLENTDKFPVEHLYHKKRNFLRLKKSSLYQNRIFGYHRLLSTNPRLSLQQKKFFTDILKNQKAKLVHAHFGPSGIEILSTVKQAKIPLVVTFHGYDASALLQFESYRTKLKKLSEYARIIAVSDLMKEELVSAGVPASKIKVVRIGIPVRFFDFIDRKPVSEKIKNGEVIKFLQVSNLIEKKGHIYTITAFSNFSKEYPNSVLTIAGEGPLREELETRSRELNILDKVEFKGRVDQNTVKNLMNESDVFLHHSVIARNGDKEGIPNVIMEAMATGLPVISTYHAGIPELITHQSDGYLVNEKDINAYTNTLISLRDMPARIGQNARKKILEKYNLDVETMKLFYIYNEMIN